MLHVSAHPHFIFHYLPSSKGCIFFLSCVRRKAPRMTAATPEAALKATETKVGAGSGGRRRRREVAYCHRSSRAAPGGGRATLYSI